MGRNIRNLCDKPTITIFLGLLICGSLLLGFNNIVHAQSKYDPQTLSPTPVPPTLTPIPLVQIPSNNNDADLNNLMEKINVISEYNDRMMNTVQWSLGLVFGFVVVFLGANWYTNNRKYRIDMENLRKKLLIDFTESIDLRFKILSEDNQRTLNRELTKIKKDITDTQINQFISEAKEQKNKGIRLNEIMYLCKAIELDPNFALLNFILDDLEKAISENTADFDVDIVKRIEKVLELIEPKNKIFSEHLKKILIERLNKPK